MPTRRTLLQAGAALGISLVPRPGRAETYPSGTVRIIVPYTPGGSTDITARIVGEKLMTAFGQRFLVDNRPGAGGNLGMDLAARAKSDGYTLAVNTTAHAINMTLFTNLTFDTIRSFAPIALLTENPLILVVNPKLPVQSVAELITLAKKSPRALHYASSGNGQSTHLAAELFCSMAGIKMIHVPYRGSAPAIQDVMAGQVEMIFDSSQSALPHAQDGAVRALGVTSKARMPAIPDVPAITETLPSYEAIAWNGLVAPAGTPGAIVDRLNTATVKALAEPDVIKRFADLGATCRSTTPAEFTTYMAKEIAKWGQVVRDSGAKID